MAQPNTPVVRGEQLILGRHQSLRVGSPAWANWLETATVFSYAPRWTSFRFTARRERRRNQLYWYAYLRNERKLHNAYLGKSAALDLARLDAVMRRLMARCRA